MADWITGFISDYGYGALVGLMFLENMFPPLPSELIMPFAGYVAARGELHPVGVVVAGSVGSLLGALAWYAVGYGFGIDRLKRFAQRHGRWLTLSADDVVQAERWFARFGGVAVCVERLIPPRAQHHLGAGRCRAHATRAISALVDGRNYGVVGTPGCTWISARNTVFRRRALAAARVLGHSSDCAGRLFVPLGAALIARLILGDSASRHRCGRIRPELALDQLREVAQQSELVFLEIPCPVVDHA